MYQNLEDKNLNIACTCVQLFHYDPQVNKDYFPKYFCVSRVA
jgi:hypothetical protein